MVKIEKLNLNLMKILMKMTESDLHTYLVTFLKKYYPTVRINEKYIIAAGAGPICLIAHMDTVFSSPPGVIFHDQEQGVLFSTDGLGADDRAGIYAILEIIMNGYLPSVIFTSGEECGGLGAKEIIKDFPDKDIIMPNVNFLIQLDRCGRDDSVYYQCDNVEFEAWINKFGFKTDFGTFTDISVLAPQWKIAAVNLSIGYLFEHQEKELLFYRRTLETTNKVIAMLEAASNKDLPADMKYVPAKPFVYCPICKNRLTNSNKKNISEYQVGVDFICEGCYNDFFKI